MPPLPDVLDSCGHVVERARSVEIKAEAVRCWVETRTAADVPAPAAPPELEFNGGRDDSANLALLLTCLNFCFWSERPWSVQFRGRTWTRTYAMYAGILRAVEQDATWLTPRRWSVADDDEVARLFHGEGCIPLALRRREVLNETGRVLLEQFDGRFSQAVERAGGDARSLAYLLADVFPSFGDAPSYHGETVAILKRAQICAADLHHSWTRQGHGDLDGLDRLTVFADYRLPQYLRHVGVLRLAPDLAAAVDSFQEIAAESDAEIELRCATVVAADLLRDALVSAGLNIPAWHLDFILWVRSHDPEVSVPHHRTRTIYY